MLPLLLTDTAAAVVVLISAADTADNVAVLSLVLASEVSVPHAAPINRRQRGCMSN